MHQRKSIARVLPDGAEGLRILRVIASANPAHGGPIEGLLKSSLVMARLGCQNEIACLDDPDDRWLADLPLKHHALGHVRRRYSYSPAFTPWLRKQAGNYDAVVVHGVWNYASVGVWRALRNGPVPYFVFTHGMLDPWFGQAQPIKNVVKQAYWTLLEGKVLRDARCVLFTSEEERRLARTAFKGHSYRERVVAYGAADPAGAPTEQIAGFRRAHQLGERPYLLFLGRIHPKKGCDLLIRAFARIADAHPELDLVLAGPDQVGWRATLEDIAGAEGVRNRVLFTGMLAGDAKWGAIRGAQAFVLPSHQENFGIAVAEAMACSTPVLITNKVNIWSEVEASGGGLVAADDESGVLDLLARFLALPESARREMGAKARSAFLRNFEIEAAAKDLVSVLREWA